MNLTVEELARVVGGVAEGVNPRAKVHGAAADSRRVRPGDVFFALPGVRADGHDFVAEALAAGATAAVVRRGVEVGDGPYIYVEDALQALGRAAGWVRDVFSPTVVGITGSTGKTSVKDLVASIAGKRLKTVASEKSFNNELGVPLTLLRTRLDTDVVMLEMGARGAGHITDLCEIARPHIGILTNIGVTHYEQFGSAEAIASAKTELVKALPAGGAAILNADDEKVMKMGSGLSAEVEVLTYGLSGGAWLRADGVRLDRMGRPTFRILRASESVWVTLSVSGKHQVHNALAASAGALALGLTLQDCRVGLESALLSPWRMQVEGLRGAILVNDAYNANPTSVTAALQTCAHMAEGGRLVAVLGHMAELGDLEHTEHRRIGALAASLTDRLVVVGASAEPIAVGAKDAGMREVAVVENAEQAAEAVGKLESSDVVLVKGSRVAALERVIEILRGGLGG
ncbi:MAG: UDP-N-acetylmuramoyl-tripeptide--D-alanyl-D-alanine ligase [Actinomycetota bacterium]